MFVLKYLAIGGGYLLAAYGSFLLLGGIGNDHIALPILGLLLLYGWYALARSESRKDNAPPHPDWAVLLAHLPLLLCMFIDVIVSHRIGPDRLTWFYAWGMPLRLPASMILKPMELLNVGGILIEYALTLLLLTVFFYMGQKQIPLKWYIMAFPTLIIVLRETGILPDGWSQLLLLLWPLWHSYEYWKWRMTR